MFPANYAAPAPSPLEGDIVIVVPGYFDGCPNHEALLAHPEQPLRSANIAPEIARAT
jgi:hypothetical protein